MIDKLNKWITKQTYKEGTNCCCLFNEQEELIRICAFHSEWRKEAIDNEREACAKTCEEAECYYPADIQGGFARLIRERSDD